MNENQNFIKLQKSIHQKEIESIKARQEEGTYPKEFDFPLGVQLELTAKCNLNCKHCYNRSAALNDSKMTIDDWKGVVNDIIAHGGVFQTIISGGEPLMVGPKLTEIMDPLHDDGTGFVLITNGYLVDDKWVNLLKKYRYYWIQVSIDHLLEAEHDDFREKKGSWKTKMLKKVHIFNFIALTLPGNINQHFKWLFHTTYRKCREGDIVEDDDSFLLNIHFQLLLM